MKNAIHSVLSFILAIMSAFVLSLALQGCSLETAEPEASEAVKVERWNLAACDAYAVHQARAGLDFARERRMCENSDVYGPFSDELDAKIFAGDLDTDGLCTDDGGSKVRSMVGQGAPWLVFCVEP